MESNEMATNVAVIGMAGRFPGAATLAQFWHNLINGVESIRFFSQAELETSYSDPVSFSHLDYISARGILENVDKFDAGFFNINPREAAIMDPQHRLFLECAWEALEHAGYAPERFPGAIGVVAGSYHNTYLLNNLYSNPSLMTLVGGDVIMHGNAHDHLATHISYKLHLSGPSFTVQTACSSSLVAIHLACQQLLNGEADMVLAGGVCVSIPEKSGYLYQEGGILSPDGHCRAFDEKAQGTVFGNGLGIVVLKRLDEALAAGDSIYAVIKGSAINNDGAAKVGYMAPSTEGQAAVIAEALAIAEVEPETITYIETHGTGTAMGDMIEIAALTSVYGQSSQKINFCGIGSVKTNIGHLNAASGVAGLIKTILSLQHKKLPPTLNVNNPNPNLKLENSPFYINSRCANWLENKFPRRAGVSSFGVGGTNVHVILEEAPKTQPISISNPQLIILSAKTLTALEEMTSNFIEHLDTYPDQALSAISYTLQMGRQEFSHRKIVVAQHRDDLIRKLVGQDTNYIFTHCLSDDASKKIVFMFPGQGSQYVTMARDLYQEQPMFRQHVDYCSEQLMPHLGVDLRTILYCESQDQIERASQLLAQTAFAQPALFVIEYALARLWMAWSIEPDYMIGHSIGEYVAACLAGVFSLNDALELVAMRGQMMQNLPEGAMLAVGLSSKEMEPLLCGTSLCIAAINTLTSCVISGASLEVSNLQVRLLEQNISHQLLHTSHAFHSHMMEGILEVFDSKLQSLRLHSPKMRFISNLTGKLITEEEATSTSYWTAHLRHTVLFAKGIESLITQQPEEVKLVFLELGPSNVLSTLVRQVLSPVCSHDVISSLRHPKHTENDLTVLLMALGKVWLYAGVFVNWHMVHEHEPKYRVPLPTYPFERSSYWIEPQQVTVVAEQSVQLGKKPNTLDWFYLPSWTQTALPFAHDRLGETSEWLVFEDICGLSKLIVKYLTSYQQSVTVVREGDQWACLDSNHFTVNLEMPEHYDALFNTLCQQNRCPNKILYLSTVKETGDKCEEMLVKTDYSPFHQLVHIAQAIGKQRSMHPINLYILTNNMQEITGQDLLHPEKAIVLGPCRVIAQEYPTIVCTSIDIELPVLISQWDDLVVRLVQEFTSKTCDIVIAYRGRQRWVQTFLPWQIQSSPVDTLPLIRKKGVYVITGGLGAIGLTLAEYLAQMCRGTIVLMSRSEFPERTLWANWLTQKEGEEKYRPIIEKILKIEAHGVTVCILRADVTDEKSMRKAVLDIHHQYGDIHGVVHAAGIAGGGLIQVKTQSLSEKVLNPKIQGSIVLAKVLEGYQLDFLVFCSSINAVLSAVGQADYCAANAFLDAYAHYLRTLGVPAVSVNWDTWQEVGMAVTTFVPDTLRDLRDESLKHGIQPEEAHVLFQYILAAQLPQIILSTQDFFAVMKQHREITIATLNHNSDDNIKTVTMHHRPTMQVDYVAPSNEIECRVAEIWEDLLDIKGIGIEDNFFDLGGHSLLASQILARLREAFGVEIPLDIIFDKPTIADISLVVEDKILEEIEMV